jgi:hypothetical protein
VWEGTRGLWEIYKRASEQAYPLFPPKSLRPPFEGGHYLPSALIKTSHPPHPSHTLLIKALCLFYLFPFLTNRE